MLEIWQADAQGRFADPQDKRALPNSSFKGFGRCGTDANGGYAFDTIKPGRCPIPTASRRRRISCSRCSRAACCCRIYSRIYFDGEARNAADPVLALVPIDRRATLIAQRRIAMATRSIVSTSICRATTRRCSSTSEGDAVAAFIGLADVAPRLVMASSSALARRPALSAALFAANSAVPTLLVEKTAFRRRLLGVFGRARSGSRTRATRSGDLRQPLHNVERYLRLIVGNRAGRFAARSVPDGRSRSGRSPRA